MGNIIYACSKWSVWRREICAEEVRTMPWPGDEWFMLGASIRVETRLTFLPTHDYFSLCMRWDVIDYSATRIKFTRLFHWVQKVLTYQNSIPQGHLDTTTITLRLNIDSRLGYTAPNYARALTWIACVGIVEMVVQRGVLISGVRHTQWVGYYSGLQ